MKRDRKRTRRTFGLLAVAAAACLLALLGSADSHQTNVPYILWKHGLNPFHSDGMRYFGRDVRFRQSFVGRPLAHLRTYFPDVVPASSSDSEGEGRGREFAETQLLRIGGSGWHVEVANGVVRSITIEKG